MFRAFWKTVLLVIADRGTWGLLLNQPLSGDDARRFRRRAILYHMVAFGMILLGGLILITSFSSSGDGAPVLPLLLIISFVVEGGWLAVYTVTSITRGFLRTPNMTRAGRRNAALLADYLVSPLAMFVLGVVTVPTLALNSGESRSDRAGFALFGFLALLAAVWLCYLIVTVVAVKSITGRSGLRLALSATGMVLLWLIAAAAIAFLTYIAVIVTVQVSFFDFS